MFIFCYATAEEILVKFADLTFGYLAIINCKYITKSYPPGMEKVIQSFHLLHSETV